MDSSTRLAIYTKVIHIFEEKESGKFLSFPIDTPFYGFNPSHLQFSTDKTGNVASSTLRTMSEFAKIVNTPSRGFKYNPNVEEYLWDVYQDILNNAETAENIAKAGDIERFNEAENFLYITHPNGIKEQSEALRKYQECRDAYYVLLEEYKNKEQTAIFSEDEALKNRWNRVEKEQFENRINELNNKWNTYGNKLQVEEKLNVISEITTSNPFVVWNELKSRFNPNLDYLSDTSASNFAQTYITPSNIEDEIWNSISLNREEIDKLIETAPVELKNILLDGEKGGGVSQITFEYRTVKVERPWFDASVFKSNLWRFPINSNKEAISYEENSSIGRFPSYTAALLLFRNLEIRKAQAGRTDLEPTTKLDPSGRVSILAFICKRIPQCPNPNPKAKWNNDFGCSSLKLVQNSNGVLEARINGKQVASSYIPVNTKIIFTAVPNDGFIMDGWVVNGKRIANSTYHYEHEISEDDLRVEVIWKMSQAIPSDSYQISPDGLILLKWTGQESEINMNNIRQLIKVTTIEEQAFAGNEYIRRVKIGNRVSTIKKGAFLNCANLEVVEVPSSTTYIADDAFLKSYSLRYPSIHVDENNPVYISLNGTLATKERVGTYGFIKCLHCGFTAYFTSKPIIDKCPFCDESLDDSKVDSGLFRKPDFHVAFKITETELRGTVKKYLKKRFFAPDDFKKIVSQTEGLKQLFIPSWEYDLKMHSIFQGRRGTVNVVEVKASDGTTSKSEEVVWSDTGGTLNETFNNLTLGVSKFSPGKQVYTSGFNVPKLRDDLFSSSSAMVELYNMDSKEGLGIVKQHIEKDLNQKILRKIEGDRKEIKAVTTEYFDINYRLLLRPIWVNTFFYKSKKYRIKIDGSTGAVSCKSPKDMKKVFWKLILPLLLALSAAALYFFMF
jgi:hypothetical protein